MINEETIRFNIKDFLKTPEEVIEYFKVSLREDTPDEFIESINEIIKSDGYAKILKNQEKNININNNKTMEDIFNVFGLQLSFAK